MEFFSGAQLAVAIEDIANDALMYSEEILEKSVIKELTHHFPVEPLDLDRKLVNGFMRGSTSINRSQLAEGIEKLQRKSKDDRDPAELVNRIVLNLDDERREIHLRRTQKSAVRQILRALYEDLNSVPTVQEHYIETFIQTQERLREKELSGPDDVIVWADSVVSLYSDLFVSEGLNENLNSRKQKGIVTYGAAKSYISVWSRFMQANTRHLIELAPRAISKPLVNNSSTFETKFISSAIQEFKSATETKVTIRISNSGENKIELSKTWKSKESAMKGLSGFTSVLKNITSPNERIDFASLQIEDDDESTYKLEEATPDTIESVFSQML